MQVINNNIDISTQGFTDIVDVTPQVEAIVAKSGIQDGQVTVFISGSTAGVTSIEYEPGLLKDLPDALEKVAPMKGPYHHDATWGDGNGYAHVRAALIGSSLTVPVVEGRMILGTWQQIVVMDFDNRPRSRQIIVQLLGE